MQKAEPYRSQHKKNGNAEMCHFCRVSFFVLRNGRKRKSKETIKNDPRECIRADNILKQNVTRFPRVSAPTPAWEGAGRQGEGAHPRSTSGVSLWTVVS